LEPSQIASSPCQNIEMSRARSKQCKKTITDAQSENIAPCGQTASIGIDTHFKHLVAKARMPSCQHQTGYSSLNK